MEIAIIVGIVVVIAAVVVVTRSKSKKVGDKPTDRTSDDVTL